MFQCPSRPRGTGADRRAPPPSACHKQTHLLPVMVRCEPRDPRPVGAPPALLRSCADRPPVSSPALLFSLTEHRLRVVARVVDVKQGARDEGVHEGVVQLAQVVEDLGGRAWGARERGRGAFFFFRWRALFGARGAFSPPSTSRFLFSPYSPPAPPAPGARNPGRPPWLRPGRPRSRSQTKRRGRTR